MQTFDLSPLFRSTVGYDRLNDMFNAAFQMEERTAAYPPYNIVKNGEDDYRIVMAVAGFRQGDITITAQENMLTVSGSQNESAESSGAAYLHKGIATRSFERKFQLADYVKVVGAELADGLLTLNLRREVPEESKPRTISINGDAKAKTIEGRKAA